MRGKKDSSKTGKARSNEYEHGRLDFIRKIYMESHARIEWKFLSMFRDRDLSQRDKEFSLMSYREGALEILGAVEKVIGVEGLIEVSKYLKIRENPKVMDALQEEPEEEDCDEEREGDDGPTPIDDTPKTYEDVDPRGVLPWEHLKDSNFPFELVDKKGPSEPEPEDWEEDDEGEELEVDIIERVANWEEVRGLWKDFDPAYR